VLHAIDNPHSLLSLYVTVTDRMSGAKSFGKLHLVDLAGSERASRSEATGIVNPWL
jgi:hypothetical protein